MPEININVKSITGPPFDLKIDDVHLPELYARVYWKMMGTKYPFVKYEDATPDRLVTLNTNLKSDNHKDWEAKSDDDGKLVYVYKPRNSMYIYGKQISLIDWISNFPPTEYAPRSSSDRLYEARSYVYPTNMQNVKDLVLITSKPLKEKRIDPSDQLPYTEDEFIEHYGEEEGAAEWRGAIPRPIHRVREADGSPGYVIIPNVWNAYEKAMGYLEEGSNVDFFFKMRNPPQPQPQPPIGGGKRKSKRKKSKKRKSKLRKSKRRRSKRRRSR